VGVDAGKGGRFAATLFLAFLSIFLYYLRVLFKGQKLNIPLYLSADRQGSEGMYYVYILQSKKDGQFYTGMTTDLQRRLYEHNGGFVTSTKSRIPFELLHSEIFNSREQACTKEKWLKSGVGREFRNSLLKK
jgi:putative endonuclease